VQIAGHGYVDPAKGGVPIGKGAEGDAFTRGEVGEFPGFEHVGSISSLKLEGKLRVTQSYRSQAFGCERAAAPCQEEKERPLSPVVAWAVRTLLYRYWPVLIAVGLGIAALVVWRVRAWGRRR